MIQRLDERKSAGEWIEPPNFGENYVIYLLLSIRGAKGSEICNNRYIWGSGSHTCAFPWEYTNANQLDSRREWEKLSNKQNEQRRIFTATRPSEVNFSGQFALEYSRSRKCFQKVQRWTTRQKYENLLCRQLKLMNAHSTKTEFLLEKWRILQEHNK